MTSSRETGFSLIEVMAAFLVLVFGVLAILSCLGHCSALTRMTSETDLGTAAIRNVMEDLRSTAFSTVDDLYGTNGSRAAFLVDSNGEPVYVELDTPAAQGTVQVFTNESNLPDDFADFNGQCDLNRNGTLEGVVSDYSMLPVRVTVTTGSGNTAHTITWDSVLIAP